LEGRCDAEAAGGEMLAQQHLVEGVGVRGDGRGVRGDGVRGDGMRGKGEGEG
jgi:hypothetical protein